MNYLEAGAYNVISIKRQCMNLNMYYNYKIVKIKMFSFFFMYIESLRGTPKRNTASSYNASLKVFRKNSFSNPASTCLTDEFRKGGFTCVFKYYEFLFSN